MASGQRECAHRYLRSRVEESWAFAWSRPPGGEGSGTRREVRGGGPAAHKRCCCPLGAPSHAGAVDAPHSAFPKAVECGGCAPPPPTRGMQRRALCPPSGAHSAAGQCAIDGSLCEESGGSTRQERHGTGAHQKGPSFLTATQSCIGVMCGVLVSPSHAPTPSTNAERVAKATIRQALLLPPAPIVTPSPPISGRSPPIWGGGGWHKASVSDCLPLAAPIGLSPLLILTLCGPERVLVVSTEHPDHLSCLTTPGLSQRQAVARAVDQVHPDAHSESMRGFAGSSTDLSALGCASAGSLS